MIFTTSLVWISIIKLYLDYESGYRPISLTIISEYFDNLLYACDLVEKGLGITVVPENFVKNLKGRKYVIKRIHDPNVMRTVYLVYDKTRYNPPIVLRSIELIKEYFKSP
ncbi:LysR substrate-binding domain-containing protein [Virgibacillus halotolerans]|uniref:LysR substrate-binding domain-containing protein n=1 Tax=Virgibacillus halotolerans TaxID=1071053 RepID=UPI00196025EC